MTSRTKTIEALFGVIGIDGIDVLVAEGCRRGLSVRQIADRLNIPLDNAEFFAIGHERPLKAGDRIRALVPLMSSWQGYGTVTRDQVGNGIEFRKDGYPPDILEGDENDFQSFGGAGEAMRYEVELTTMPELLPAGTAYDGDGHLVVPCGLTQTGKQLEFYCPHCKQMHRHGNGGGHRVSHCIKQDSPLRRGYYIVAKH